MRFLTLTVVAVTAMLVAGGVSVGASPRTGSAANRCPPSSNKIPFRRDAAVRRRLVPGRPDSVVLCRYHGLNAGAPLSLAEGHALRGAARARPLAQLFNDLRKFPPGATACPADFERDIVARFHYPHAPDDYVLVDRTGCPSATNGSLTRSALSRAGQRLIRALNRLI